MFLKRERSETDDFPIKKKYLVLKENFNILVMMRNFLQASANSENDFS